MVIWILWRQDLRIFARAVKGDPDYFKDGKAPWSVYGMASLMYAYANT